MNRIAFVFVAVVLFGLVRGGVANLLLNPGYESAVMTTWSTENETTNWLGAGDGVEQKPNVTADLGYDLSFYSLYDGGYDGSLSVQVRWLDSGGAQIGSNSIAWNQGAGDTWNLTSVRVTSIVSSARAEINISNSGGTAGALYFDDVDFTAIPEPTTAALFGFVGLGALALRRFKR
jgi:hypothetical protein